MNLNLKYFAAAAAFAAALSATAEPYKVIVPLEATDNGAMARMVDFDSGAALDSTVVADGVAVFQGSIDEPVMARILCNGRRLPSFILESGTISQSKEGEFFGTMLNDQLRAVLQELKTIQADYGNATTDAQRAEIYAKYVATLSSAVKDNADSVLGLYFFLQTDAPELDGPALRARLEEYPQFAKSKRVQGYLANAEKREATSVGQKFKDFEVTYNGKTEKLSDYVGKGKYVLVDFWASWCGPCIRQTKVLKEIYQEYKDKGLEVLGVAVWDEPEATKKAIEQHKLPWPCIIDAQTIPTDIYGITGIPCIILFGPDGTILSRDKQGDELKADVAAAMDKQ